MSPVATPRRAPVAAPRAVAPPPPPQTGGSVNFGEDGFYFGGLGLPEGNYVCYFHTQMFQPVKASGEPGAPAFLAVMLTPFPILKDGTFGEQMEPVPLGCGRKAHLSFMPSADSKGFEPVANGPNASMAGSTNWNLFRTSVNECNGGPTPLNNDLSVWDGLWAHIQQQPEPEERKHFGRGRKTEEQILAEANGQAIEEVPDRGPKMVPTVTEILEGGKPWEGGGGLSTTPEPTPMAPPARLVPGPRPAPVTAPAGPRRAPVAPPPPVQEEVAPISDEDLAIIAMQGATDYLSAAKAAVTSVQLRTGVFSAVAKAQGNEIANAVLEMYFGNEENVNVLINPLGFKQAGNKVSR